LIDEAVSKWAVEQHRSLLARTFEHTKMTGICDDVVKTSKSGGRVAPGLLLVAQNFIELQQHRHTADYDNAVQWSQKDAVNALKLASDAFYEWRGISDQDGIAGLFAATIAAETAAAIASQHPRNFKA
jgi:hypothetical protein